jgi:hypothetical protein
MKGVAYRWILVGITAIGVALPARAADQANVTDADRVYRNYTREAATVGEGQVRLELRALGLQDGNNTRLNLLGFRVRESVHSETGGIFDLLGSYGLGKVGEAGFLVPVFVQNQKILASDGSYYRTENKDVGDVQLYTKFKRPVAEHCAMAGGVELSIPTGIERKSFGTGEVAVNPFLSTRYQNGRLAVGAHIGYQVYTGNVPDILNYSVEVIARANETYAFRAELSGRLFTEKGDQYHDVVVLPGIDYTLTPNLTLRPTGLANVTDEAIDWGLGMGVAYTF